MGLHSGGCSQRGPPKYRSMGFLQVLNPTKYMKQRQPNQHRSSWLTSLRNRLAGAFIGLLFCADGFANAGIINKGVPVKIMPVGDSITEGKYTQGGYRKPLYQLLKDNGYSATFVGKEDNGDPCGSPKLWPTVKSMT